MSASTLAVAGKYAYFTPNTLTVGTSAVALPAPSATLNSGAKKIPPETILIQSSFANTAIIYLGNSSVTAAGGAGIELSPGSSYELPTRDYSKWYAISGTASQKLQVLYLNASI